MDVQLYVYDLSRGLARQMSMQFLGTHIDAVYHTSLVFGNIEYFFGLGVQTCYPGTTHHGRPMEVVAMGRTELPIEVILEYLESLKQIYTPESYDLFAHNCNNFTNDFAQFLVGRKIPEHITNLPRTVLETPFGQMLRPQIDQAMRQTTQAPLPPQSRTPPPVPNNKPNGHGQPQTNGVSMAKAAGEVHNINSTQRLDQLLDGARSSCAIVFFTSATCPPCKLVYPTYDELAAEAGDRCCLVKVDISQAQDIARRYDIRATPTFITFLKGKQESTWNGASPAQLRGNVRMLIESAFPSHSHEPLSLGAFRRQSTKRISYSKVPPLEKLQAKMGDVSQDPGIVAALHHIRQRNTQQQPSQETRLPDMALITSSLERLSASLPVELRFTMYDILRLLLLDPRISGYYVSSPSGVNTLRTLFVKAEANNPPYNLQLCALHAACNIFSANHALLLSSGILIDGAIVDAFNGLISTGLQDKAHATLRVAASSLAFNMATVVMKSRLETQQSAGAPAQVLSESTQVELAAALIQSLGVEPEDPNPDVIKLGVLALGRLVYAAPLGAEVLDLCEAMEAKEVVARATTAAKKEDRTLLHEVGVELLGKGLKVS